MVLWTLLWWGDFTVVVRTLLWWCGHYCGVVIITVVLWILLWCCGHYCGVVDITVVLWTLLWWCVNYCSGVDISVVVWGLRRVRTLLSTLLGGYGHYVLLRHYCGYRGCNIIKCNLLSSILQRHILYM